MNKKEMFKNILKEETPSVLLSLLDRNDNLRSEGKTVPEYCLCSGCANRVVLKNKNAREPSYCYKCSER